MFAVSVDSRTATTTPRKASFTDEPPLAEVTTPLDTTTPPQQHTVHDSPNWSAAADYDELLHKILNGILLTLAFGSAIYAVVNIDAGMTRGWTQSVSTSGGGRNAGAYTIRLVQRACSHNTTTVFTHFLQEIAMRIPLDTWSSYEVALEAKPVATKTIINVVIYLLGDWLSQTVFQKKNILEFDALRTLRNGFIGLCFGPLVVEYYQFSDRILPVDGGLLNRVEKILMDQTLYLTVKCSIYIMAVGVLQGDSVQTAAQNVKDKLAGIVKTAWKFWPLIHCITYSVIPAQHRILWVNMVDLVWNAILSSISQKDSSLDEEGAPLLADAGLATDGTLLVALPFVEERQDTNGALRTISLLENTTEDAGALPHTTEDAGVLPHTTEEKPVEADLTVLHTTMLEEEPTEVNLTLIHTAHIMEKSSETDLALPEEPRVAAEDKPANGDEATPLP
jgi:protein Mpv17